jgi:pimeloyl-ACP methyl ester carboxylesterase
VKLVLLPGLDGTGVLFKPFIERLPAALSPVVVSYPADRQLGYAELLKLVQRQLPAEPFLLLGESFSGPLALMAAAACPAGLKAVILCATFVQNPTWLRWRGLAPLVRPLAFRLYPKFSAAKALLGHYSTPELRKLIAETIGAVRPEVFAHRVRAVINVNASDQLLACPVPILYLRGSRDLVVPERNLREVRRLMPHVQVAYLDAPHMVLQTQPDAAVGAVLDFVRSAISAESSDPPSARRRPASPAT